MKLATWNVNSLKVRLPHVADWLQAQAPDVLCLQETKLEDSKFPLQEITELGYRAIFSGQKTYNGVAVLSKEEALEPIAAIPNFEDAQKRVLATTIAGVRVICAYMPNGQSLDSDKYQYKLKWLAALRDWLRAHPVR